MKKYLDRHHMLKFTKIYKYAVAITVLLVCIFFVFSYRRISSVNLQKKAGFFGESGLGISDSRQVMVNGYSWKDIESLEIKTAVKTVIKSRILRITLDTSFFSSGEPIIIPSGDIEEYVSYVDRFYAIEKNRDIPVFFALKISDMAKNNYPEPMIESYKYGVQEKLKQLGVIK